MKVLAPVTIDRADSGMAAASATQPGVRVAGRRGGRLLATASALALFSGLVADPALAQLARMRANAGIGITPAATAQAAGQSATAGIVRPATRAEALARAQALQSRADQVRGFIVAARDAALASSRTQPANGLNVNGLSPIAAVRDAIQKSMSADAAVRAEVPGILASLQATRDASGAATWHNLNLPTETLSGGQTIVNLVQTDARAIASWDRFDIGAQTTLRVEQKLGGVDQTGWTLINRVANAVAPSTVLGRIEAPGTVLVLNSRGVFFGQSAQVNAYSFLASTLDIGAFFATAPAYDVTTGNFTAASLQARNLNFISTGLFSGVSSAPNDEVLAAPLLFSPLYASGSYGPDARPALEGNVEVDPGAKITTASGGVLVLAAPTVINRGELSATNGQVSLQAGRFITYRSSTGADDSFDPQVRGYVLNSVVPRAIDPLAPSLTGDDGQVVNAGLITSVRGYASLGTTIFGGVTSSGLIDVTTSVSRNGKIGLFGGNVTLTGNSDAGRAAGLRILPDANGEVIPQGTADQPADFKTSSIVVSGFVGRQLPTVFAMGANSFILAPGADVVIGRDPAVPVPTPVIDVDTLEIYRYASSINIGSNATIDVSGVKGVAVDGNRNFLTIDPVKRNELRDTPTYREVRTDGGFTLNGTELTVDIRKSGVRDDGVRWIGSPLLEAGSAASQVSVTAAELLSAGGTVTMGVAAIPGVRDPALVPAIELAAGATIDISGGWLSYSVATKGASRLRTADGRAVDIALADRNDVFIGVINGFDETQSRFGVTSVFGTPLNSTILFETAYDEGRDAGALVLTGSAIDLRGQFFGNAFAGRVQIGAGSRGTAQSPLPFDTRALQANRTELPSGGFVRIGAFDDVGGDILGAAITLYRGDRASDTSWRRDMLIDADMVSAAGLGVLRLQTSGGVTLAGAGDLAGLPIVNAGDAALGLSPGGELGIDAGRSILFNGRVEVPAGRILARTYEFGSGLGGINVLTQIGSPFTTGDDLAFSYDVAATLPARTFDIVVNNVLSVAGLWTNSLTNADAIGGGAFLNGGSISLAVAPKVLTRQTSAGVATNRATDLSGRIEISGSARLELSAGGYVQPDRSFVLTGRGGDLRLVNETTYASVQPTVFELIGEVLSGSGDNPINGTNQTVDFTQNGSVVAQIMPDQRRAAVLFDEDGITAFGFTGGGTFALVAPDIRFNSAADPMASNISLDFLARTGFGTLALKSYRSRFVENLFSNGRNGVSAFLDTTTFRVRDGQTLDLTQVELPRFLSTQQSLLLRDLVSGSDVVAALRPTVADGVFTAPTAVFDRQAANLRLEGLGELVVDAGGRIETAAPGARIDTAKLLNNGTIRLPGGIITQRDVLTPFIGDNVLAVRGVETGGAGLAAILGPADADGRFDENFVNPALGVSNRSLFSVTRRDTFLFFAGDLDLDEGVRLGATSLTDLSGGPAIYDPRAAFRQGGQLRVGILPDGGIVTTASGDASTAVGLVSLFDRPIYGTTRTSETVTVAQGQLAAVTYARRFSAATGARLDLSGSTGVFDEAISGNRYAAGTEWSNAGTLSVLGGGVLTAGVVRAEGGAAAAVGGTLEWLRPVLAATANGTPDLLGADAIRQAGFDTLVARGGFTASGAVDLVLDRALLVSSAPSTLGPTRGGLINREADYAIAALPGARARIAAPYVRFDNRLGSSTAPLATAPGDGQLVIDAGANGIDIAGALTFGASLASVRLASAADIRFSGVNDVATVTEVPALNGEVVGFGALTFDAVRVYGTTGTGNLQRSLEEINAASGLTTDASSSEALRLSSLPFRISADSITIDSSGARRNGDRSTPLSAGSYLRLTAGTIAQNGALYAPLGVLEIGSNGQRTLLGELAPLDTSLSRLRTVTTSSIDFGANSLTSVSIAGQRIPYGTTTDLTELFFSPTVASALTRLPAGELRLAAGTVNFAGTAARVDGRGGGDTFAFEFVSSVGGSRDVLSRFNRDLFSSNALDPVTGNGLQYADGRQVFALLPVASVGALAAFDPVFSADYGADGPVNLYGEAAGRMVRLDPAPGFAGGDYLLLPGHYALLPGAFRLVENVGLDAPAPDQAQRLLDGSFVVGGNFATAGTGFAEAQRRSFSVQDAATLARFARIDTTSGTTAITRSAGTGATSVARLPADAARVVLAPLQALTGTGFFDTAAATGGRGAQVDIAANNILVATDGTTPTSGVLTLTAASLATLNANSLFLGGSRADRADGTTALRVTATDLTVAANVTLQAPEVLLAVAARETGSGAPVPRLTIADGATVRANGTLSNSSNSDYVIATRTGVVSSAFDETGVGATVRVANGPERLVTRIGDGIAANGNRPVQLTVRAASITGQAVGLESSGLLSIALPAIVSGQTIALSGDQLVIANNVSDAQLARYQAADRFTLTSSAQVRFGAGSYDFGALVIDAPGIGLQAAPAGVQETVNLVSDSLILRNRSSVNQAPCGGSAAPCGTTSNRLFVTTGELVFGAGNYGTFGFDGTVALRANLGAYYEGVGTFDVSETFLTLTTPFIADRRGVAGRIDAPPALTIIARDNLVIDGRPFAATIVPTGDRLPGARLNLGTADRRVGTLTIDSASLLATAGIIDANVSGDILLRGSAALRSPGFARDFGDAVDPYTVLAPAGTISLATTAGSISLGAGTIIDADNGTGNAGALRLLAGKGFVELSGRLNSATGTRAASLMVDAGLAAPGTGSAFDLSAFLAGNAARFQGDIAIRSGAGDLAVAAGQTLTATSVRLTADNGRVLVDGTIRTAGVNVAGLSPDLARNARANGGDINLFGNAGVALGGNAVLDSSTSGYASIDSRVASAGDVTIGIGGDSAARLTIAAGATIDVSAARSRNRLVAETTKDPASLADVTVYRFAEADRGGDVLLRAPVLAGGQVGIELPATPAIVGAASQSIEGYRTYDLDLLDSLGFFGLSGNGGRNIDLNINPDDPRNIFADDFAEGGIQSIPNFIRNFAIASTNGAAFTGFRQRPGIDITSKTSIILVSNWNLAAADVDIDAAVTAGLMVEIPQYQRRDPITRLFEKAYAVVAGQESALLERSDITRFLYRVGGRADGEAPIISIRAAGLFQNEGVSEYTQLLSTANSISDGFFNFRDRSDPDYVNLRLGGGFRNVLPAAVFTCAGLVGSNCGDVLDFFDVARGDDVFQPGTSAEAGNGVTINLTQIVAGALAGGPLLAPFNPSANAAAAIGGVSDLPDGSEILVGDPLGTAELFPLINGGRDTIRSSSYRIVAGADLASADPLRVDLTTPGDVLLIGTNSYQLRATLFDSAYSSLEARRDGSGSFALALRFTPPVGGTNPDFVTGIANRDVLRAVNDEGGPSAENTDSYTVLTWGAGQSTRARFLRENALRYFNSDFSAQDLADFEALTTADRDLLQAGDRRLVGILQGPSVTASTGIAVRLSDALAFLDWQYRRDSTATVGGELSRLIVTGAVPTGLIARRPAIAYSLEDRVDIVTRIRTGDGDISIASSRDVNTLRNATFALPDAPRQYRTAAAVGTPNASGGSFQIGGAAIYTAGVRIPTATVLSAATADGTAQTDLRWNTGVNITSTLSDADYLPGPRGQYLQDPVLSYNGGSITVGAVRDVVGRRDIFGENALSLAAEYTRTSARPAPGGLNLLGNLDAVADVALRLGASGQTWRVGASRASVVAASAPDLFRSGFGALAGGDVAVSAGRDIVELTVVTGNNAVNADTRATSLLVPDAIAGTTPRVLASFGSGDVRLDAGRNVVGGQIDVASGRALVRAGDAVAASTIAGARDGASIASLANDLRLRITDATVSLAARQAVVFDSVTSLGLELRPSNAEVAPPFNSRGDITALSGLDVVANGLVRFAARQTSVITTLLTSTYGDGDVGFISSNAPAEGLVLPGTLTLAALNGGLSVSDQNNSRLLFMLPSQYGQLRLLSGGNIDGLSLVMSDVNPAFLPGNFSVFSGNVVTGRDAIPSTDVLFGFPIAVNGVVDLRLRNFHNQTPTHLNNADPVRIAADGDLNNLIVNLPKQSRLYAGRDIRDIYFTGQNLDGSDVTRIVAGRDIIATLDVETGSGATARSAFTIGNNFVLGGPGSLIVEAGRNLGPFLSSGNGDAGGIRTIGNFLNPWLDPAGADIRTLFGIANGADYAALREVYLNPANAAGLDGDLFVQYLDVSGNRRPLNPANVAALLAAGTTNIRIEILDDAGALVSATLATPAVLPVRSATLGNWLRRREPAAYAAAIAGIDPGVSFGSGVTAAQQAQVRTTLTAALAAAPLYQLFNGLELVRQQDFLAGDLLFAELREPALPNGSSLNQFIRGYRAVQTLFPTSRGYTDNLAAYTVDPATITPDRPLGVPTRRLGADGQPLVADRVFTGNADLRLATIQTLVGGDITVIAPGGDLIAGSVVRTSEQIARRSLARRAPLEGGGRTFPTAYQTLDLGLEGLLSLQSGQLRGFFDGDFRLNQSRAFSIGGGNITFWSSNGDLNAGQGPRSASSFPPVTIRQTPDGVAEVNSVGSVAGAGIGSFKRNPEDDAASIVLVAPVGEVDAGDAGVRASGDIFVAAARVANADNFKAGGSISGVPSGVGSVAPPPPPGATAAQQAAATAGQQGNSGERRSVINVDVLGAVDPCADPANRDPNCVRTNP